MSNNDFIAFEYALGLLDREDRQAIEKTNTFEKTQKQWQLHLSKLNTQAPLDKKSAQKIWEKINTQIKLEKTNIIQSWVQSWRYLLVGFTGFALILGFVLFNQKNVNTELGWDISTDLSKQQLLITRTTHQHLDQNKVCVLWVKKEGRIVRIGLMPQFGKKIFNISVEAHSMIKGGEMIISSEGRENQALTPTVIDYQRKWNI